MERTLVSKLETVVGEKVRICGWAQSVRNQKNVQFVIIRDHSGLIQVTHQRSNPPNKVEETISALTLESAIEIVGTVVKNERVNLRQIEVLIDEINVVSPAQSQLPIDSHSSLEHRMDWRYLDLRRPESLLVFRVQTTAEQALRNFAINDGFLEIHSPKLMGSASESGSDLFKVPYFGTHAYLAQSPQFYKQMAMAAGFDRVLEIGPVFRANPSFTSRHDTEFTSVDVEISWIDSHEDVMHFEELWLQHTLQVVHDRHGEEILRTFGVEIKPPTVPFPRITMAEAYKILESGGHVVQREDKGDLDPEGERRLSEYIQMEYGHEFVFIKDYPITARPFYHMRCPEDPSITRSFDLLFKGLEITTGAQREHRQDALIIQAKEMRIELEPIQYYLDFFLYGCPPHGGYGFGLTRMLMVLLGFKNVREVTYLYRGPNRLTP